MMAASDGSQWSSAIERMCRRIGHNLNVLKSEFLAARKTGDAGYADVAAEHTSRVLDIHMRRDGSIVHRASSIQRWSHPETLYT